MAVKKVELEFLEIVCAPTALHFNDKAIRGLRGQKEASHGQRRVINGVRHVKWAISVSNAFGGIRIIEQKKKNLRWQIL
jgi:hypothetical protein